MEIKNASSEDFEIAFNYIEKLWDYNSYNKETIKNIYEKIISNENDFAFFIFENNKALGFCHGTFFNTFWLSGLSCYVSTLITNEDIRGNGYGQKLMDHAKELAKNKKCKAIILDSGMPRSNAHKFYEKYGFEKGAYCFELKL